MGGIILTNTIVLTIRRNDVVDQIYKWINNGEASTSDDSVELKEGKKILKAEKVVPTYTAFQFILGDEQLTALEQFTLRDVLFSKDQISPASNFSAISAAIGEVLKTSMGVVYGMRNLKYEGNAYAVYYVFTYPTKFFQTSEHDTIPTTVTIDSSTARSSAVTPQEFSSAFNESKVVTSMNEEPVWVQSMPLTTSFLDIEVTKGAIAAIQRKAMSREVSISSNEELVSNINIAELVKVRKDGGNVSFTMMSKERSLVKADGPATRLEAVVLPMGHGKTYLSNVFNELLDVDKLIPQEKNKELSKLRSEAVASGKWDEYNKLWISLIKDAIDENGYRDKPYLLAVHDVSAAKKLSLPIKGIIVLDDFSKVEEALKKRGDNEENLKLGRMNYDLVKGDSSGPRYEVGSLADVQKVIRTMLYGSAASANERLKTASKDRDDDTDKTAQEKDGLNRITPVPSTQLTRKGRNPKYGRK